nr:P44/Msp2 family outer membrane protein [Anaplasma marginale]
MLTALEGSIGYSIGGARVEVEVGYERFVIKGGKKSNEDTASVFLLGKELAYDTARGQVDRLATALGKMTKGEAHKWGTTVEAATNGQTVSQKVCGKGTGSTGTTCGKSADSQSTNSKLGTVFNAEGADAISSMDTTTTSGASGTISLQGMATNINGLSKEEKAVVAGAFARAVEGAEVIEVRAIGSTSVMLNAWHCHHQLEVLGTTDITKPLSINFWHPSLTWYHTASPNLWYLLLPLALSPTHYQGQHSSLHHHCLAVPL